MMQYKWRYLILGTLVTSLMTMVGVYLHWGQGKRSSGSFINDIIGSAPPRRTPETLIKIINSPAKIDQMDADELLVLCQDVLQAFIHPNMGFEEVIRVRTALLGPLLALHDRSTGGKVGGEIQ